MEKVGRSLGRSVDRWVGGHKEMWLNMRASKYMSCQHFIQKCMRRYVRTHTDRRARVYRQRPTCIRTDVETALRAGHT